MENKKRTPVFTLLKDGPLKVSGNFSIKKDDGKVIETGADVFLCRCGKSSRKPFCDGSHKLVK